MSKCHRPLNWDDYSRAQDQQQMSIDPEQFFGCNPYGNAAQIEHLRELDTAVSPAGDEWQTGWSHLKDQAILKSSASSDKSISSCEKDAATSYIQSIQANADNTSSGEFAELISACSLGATFASEGGPVGLAVGCVGGMLLNEIAELMTDTIVVSEDLIQCQ